MSRAAVLVASVATRSADTHGREADVWHANQYLPAMRAGLLGVPFHRFTSPARAAFVTIWELEDAAAVETAKPLVSAAAPRGNDGVEQTLYLATSLGTPRKRDDAGSWQVLVDSAPILYAVTFRVPQGREDVFNRWYEDEHLGLLLGCPDWMACRRFRIATPHPQGQTHLALHYISDMSALQSPERNASVATPWRDRLVAEGWFKGDYRLCYRSAPPVWRG